MDRDEPEPKGEGRITRLPQHVAIIMDGNGRWAQRRKLPRHAGHQAGVGAVRSSVELCVKHGIKVLTLFAFSSENWQRPKKEVGLLMDLFMTALQRDVKRLQKNNVQLRIIGDRKAFSEKLQQRIRTAEDSTRENTGLILQVAANYGGRWDITQAVKHVAAQVKAGELKPEDITEDKVNSELSFPQLPDPDLFIRTGGEKRLSNFLLWQSAYAELYFTDVLWPDFKEEAFDEALREFARRERRFGKTSEQVEGFCQEPA